ncbi:NAD(P) transhydrogenase subunit alpha [Lignipirellula cremea]|uniref:proton-translocating NAD(P)(+) transhydrogenase n=2 Tax=Lignipirellula cremea TaxID=2528010 RepID=A0A518DLV8_9BACT|nr:NAD(P) transhydrogenase subunit alpha [Lignipirellula cremea]QDU92827.1 NAD(P) transhydrogenase subunit alpha [Lignipirellula cremea]
MSSPERWSTGILGVLLVCLVLTLGGIVYSSIPGAGHSDGQESPALPGLSTGSRSPGVQPLLAELSPPVAGNVTPVALETDPVQALAIANRRARLRGLVDMLTIFAVSVFVGFEVITKVPPTLHTPLMSGSNAVSGITIVGAVIVATSVHQAAAIPAMLAVLLAAINVVGGFLVTHRMLSMFKKK